jgi:hypothetical protein
MKQLIVAIVLSTALGVANAGNGKCISNDAWTGPDKSKHALVGAAIGSMSTLVFKDKWAGIKLGAAVALAKEIHDAKGKGTCSFQDFAVTVAAAAAASYGTVYIITPRYVGVNIKF